MSIFAHYDTDKQIKAYVIYYLQQLKLICEDIIFVSTSKLDESECVKLNSLCSKLIIRENIGHDFYSYKVGIESIENLRTVNQLILCNDSCFGPLYSLAKIFNEPRLQNSDFWGMSANSRPIFHLQSFFLVFNRQVIQSDEFKQFWRDLQILTDKDQLVLEYEVGLSQRLKKAGFHSESYLPSMVYHIGIIKLILRKLNVFFKEFSNSNSRYSWKNLFEPLTRIDKTITLYDVSIEKYHFPFLKKSLLNDQWVDRKHLINIIASTEYDKQLINEILDD